MTATATVHVVEDDPALTSLFRVVAQSLELRASVYASADELLQAEFSPGPKCLVLDLDLPGMRNLDVLAELARRQANLPAVVIGSTPDNSLSAKTLQTGVVAFLKKPFRLQDLCDALHAALLRSEQEVNAGNRSATTVLLVDDSPSITQFLRSYLETRGYAVLQASRGLQALDLAASHRPDVILLDVMMPDMDGLTVCRRLRADPELQSTPVILVTARADEDDVVRGLDAGADDYVTKPVNLRVLGARLRSALRVKKGQDTIAKINRELQHELEYRHRVEEELVQAHKLEAIGRLAAGVAHEINTPAQYLGDNIRFLDEAFSSLTELLGALDGLRAETGPAASPAEILAEIRSRAAATEIEYLRKEVPSALRQSLAGVEQIASIVRAMKEFSHPGSGQRQLLDINRAIENTVAVTRNQWKYVAEVVTDLDAALPRVPCFIAAFNQVILNLLVNAAEAIAEVVDHVSAQKGTITVRTRHDADWAEIQIADTGAGIPEHARGKVFEPFFTTKDVGKGTGQGLAIARATIVEKHGGTIGFQTKIGRGTTFTVRLPLGVPPAPAPDSRQDDHVASGTAR
jgi:DNA-binding response OmpR family regulator